MGPAFTLLLGTGMGAVVVAGLVAGTVPANAEVAAISPFDVGDPAIGRLDPALRSAVQQAAAAAAADGVSITVTSGWRSLEFQQWLLDDAVAAYGSVAAARRFVQTPGQSRHVLGQAADLGGAGADQWLTGNAARFGLCRIYANEPWHFELAAGPGGGCPPLLPDASYPGFPA